jgi:hypothetical protein
MSGPRSVGPAVLEGHGDPADLARTARVDPAVEAAPGVPRHPMHAAPADPQARGHPVPTARPWAATAAQCRRLARNARRTPAGRAAPRGLNPSGKDRIPGDRGLAARSAGPMTAIHPSRPAATRIAGRRGNPVPTTRAGRKVRVDRRGPRVLAARTGPRARKGVRMATTARMIGRRR